MITLKRWRSLLGKKKAVLKNLRGLQQPPFRGRGLKT